MSQFAGKAIKSQVRLSVREEAAAQSTMTDGHHHEILHAVRTAIRFLTQCRDMRIVSHRHSQSQLVAQHSSQRYHPFPGQIGSILYTARNRASTWSTHTYRADGFVTTVLLNQRYHLLAEGGHKVVHIMIVGRQKVVLRNYLSPDVHHGKSRAVHPDVYTHYTGFDLINSLCHII